MRHFTNRSAGWIGMAALLAMSLPVQAATIFNESFDGADKTSLTNSGWNFDDDQGRATIISADDSYLRLQGGTDVNAAPTVWRTLGGDVAEGSFHAVLGTATSAAFVTLRAMDGSTTLFSLYIYSPGKVYVNSEGQADEYSTDVAVNSNTNATYGNRLDAVFSWQVAPEGTGGTFSYVLSQLNTDPDPTNTPINTGLVTGRSFLADGVPDRIELEMGLFTLTSRLVYLYQLDASAVPEPGMVGLLGVGASSLLLKRRRKEAFCA